MLAKKVGEAVTTAMPDDGASKWFGGVPPDLSLVARSKGTDWIYTYLRSFYTDDSRIFGVNNTVLVNASMPHVLVATSRKPVCRLVSMMMLARYY